MRLPKIFLKTEPCYMKTEKNEVGEVWEIIKFLVDAQMLMMF